MYKKTLLDTYRAFFTLALALTIVVSSLFEIVAYFIFVNSGRCELSFSDEYLKNNVFLPILINACMLLFVIFLNRFFRIPNDMKNEIIVYCASAVSFVISVFHREFIVTSATFLFPMILSTMFNNKKLVVKTTIISAFAITVTIIFSRLDGPIDLLDKMNYFAMYGFLVVAFLVCSVSVKFSQLNYKTIEKQDRTNNRLQSIILLDPMTELYNHRTFYDKLDNFIENFEKEDSGFCLALIDLDNFKDVNDRYGHDCGDVVLKTLAEIMKEVCDDEDMAFRYGGEEFAIIFSEKSLEESCKRLSYIAEVFSNQRYHFTNKMITFSGGIANYDGMLSREQFFNSVDNLLYKSKNSGKNLITYYD